MEFNQCYISSHRKLKNVRSGDPFSDTNDSSGDVNGIDTEDECENEK